MSNIIKRSTNIPARHIQTYYTCADHQKSVHVGVYEGERPMFKDNFKLGAFNLNGIAQLPRGQAKIEVTFDVDINGLLHVTANEKINNVTN